MASKLVLGEEACDLKPHKHSRVPCTDRALLDLVVVFFIRDFDQSFLLIPGIDYFVPGGRGPPWYNSIPVNIPV